MDVAEIINDVLSHHGIKGMKWGIRREHPSGPQPVEVRPSKFPGSKKLKTSGGGGHPAHEEAVRARTIGQIGKASGVRALSNQDLETYARRLNLEQNVRRLNYNEANPGKKFVLGLIGKTGRETANDAAKQVASHQVKKKLVKAGLIAATA